MNEDNHPLNQFQSEEPSLRVRHACETGENVEIANLNKELMQKIANQIRLLPKQFDMSEVVCNVYKEEKPHCGTVACIAGWSIILSGKSPEALAEQLDNNLTTWIDEAANLLGLSREFAECLFHECYWPRIYRDIYNSAESDVERAHIAADLLEDVIAGKIACMITYEARPYEE